METKKPLKTTLLFIGIFLLGLILVILFINNALDTDHATVIPVDTIHSMTQVTEARV